YSAGPADQMLCRGATAITEIAPALHSTSNLVPSIGSTARSNISLPLSKVTPSHNTALPSMRRSSPIATHPPIPRVTSILYIASVAAVCAASKLPDPIQRPAANAAASVTRVKSRPILREVMISSMLLFTIPDVTAQRLKFDRRQQPGRFPRLHSSLEDTHVGIAEGTQD